jgi:VWFA-related protein
MMKRLLGMALVFGLAFPTLETAVAQETKLLAGQRPLQHDVSVTLKLIQVYVTDKKGAPVTDLEREDFILTDDGREVEITDFERHALEIPGKPEPRVSREELPAPLLSRKYLFLIDFSRNDVFGVQWARDAALRFLETRILPDDEAAVMAVHSSGGLVLHENLTRDHEKIREVLRRIKGVSGHGLGGGIPLLGEGAGAGGVETAAVFGEEGVDEWNSDWEQIKTQAFRFTLVMQDLARSLRYVPGFKNIIFFSSGVGRGILNDLEDSRVRREYERMIRELATAGCSVFTVNAEGQRAFLRDPSERGTDSLIMLSDGSGGRYFHDVKQADEIAGEIQDVTGNFYVLGYPVEEARDGKFHPVKVEVRRPGCRAITQEGYFNPGSFRKSSKVEKELHLADLALSERPQSQDPLRIPVTAFPGPGRDGAEVLLLSEIDVGRLEEILGEGAEMVALVYDDRNEAVFTRRGEIRRDSLDPRDRILYPYVSTPLRPGAYKCRVVLRNLETGRGAVGAVDLRIPEEPPFPFSVQAPLLFIPDSPTLFLSFSKAEKKDAGTEIAPLLEIFPQISNRMTPVLDVLDAGVTRLILMARAVAPGDREEASLFKMSLVEASTGETTDIPLRILEITKGAPLSTGGEARADTLVAEVSLAAAGPGRYRLVLEAADPRTGAKAEAGRDLTIR